MPLAARFDRVVATDASEAQLAHAERHPRITFRQCRESDSGLESGSVDAVTVAQALHWFDLDAFFAEARRVLRPGGLLVAWGYTRPRIVPEINAVVDEFHDRTVGPCWPPERRLIDNGYADLLFPFTRVRLDGEPFAIEANLTLDDFLAYVGTWSAVLRYRAEHGADSVGSLRELLVPLWPPDEPRLVGWPLVVLVGRR